MYFVLFQFFFVGLSSECVKLAVATCNVYTLGLGFLCSRSNADGPKIMTRISSTSEIKTFGFSWDPLN